MEVFYAVWESKNEKISTPEKNTLCAFFGIPKNAHLPPDPDFLEIPKNAHLRRFSGFPKNPEKRKFTPPPLIT